MAQSGQIGRGVQPALRHHDPLARDPGCQSFADGEGGLEGVEVAVVDADEPRPEAKRAFELIFLMNFNQNVHPIV